MNNVMMTPEMRTKLKRSVILHENYEQFPYIDTKGKVTIGIGYNLTDRGMTDDWINSQYEKDVEYFYEQLSQFPWWHELNEDRQIVLIDMAFMGIKKLLEFKLMFDALDKKDYNRAAFEMLNSDWAKQVKNRAAQLAQGMLTGIYHV